MRSQVTKSGLVQIHPRSSGRMVRRRGCTTQPPGWCGAQGWALLAGFTTPTCRQGGWLVSRPYSGARRLFTITTQTPRIGACSTSYISVLIPKRINFNSFAFVCFSKWAIQLWSLIWASPILATIALPTTGCHHQSSWGKNIAYLWVNRPTHPLPDTDSLKTKHSLGKPLLPVRLLQAGYWAKKHIMPN